MKTLTMRERIRAVIRGEPLDRVPFVQYDSMIPNADVWALVGRENMGLLRWVGLHRVERPNCSTQSESFERHGVQGRRTVLKTPRGTLTEETLIQPTYGAGAIQKHYVQKPEDYAILQAYIEDAIITEDLTGWQRAQQELGDDGLPLVAVDRTPYQQLWVQWVGIEDLAVHLVECPERVEPCIQAMIRHERQIFEIVARARVDLDFVDFPDNITSPMIGETYFRRFCLPLYNELGDMLAARNVPVFVHMDGDLKPLWRAIGESRVRGLDSLSPPPDNDTAVDVAARMWPHMRFFVNFPSSVHIAGPETVYMRAGELLAQAGHTGRLQIQISENVPPDAWRTSYPAIVRAIRDFGKP